MATRLSEKALTLERDVRVLRLLCTRKISMMPVKPTKSSVMPMMTVCRVSAFRAASMLLMSSADKDGQIPGRRMIFHVWQKLPPMPHHPAAVHGPCPPPGGPQRREFAKYLKNRRATAPGNHPPLNGFRRGGRAPFRPMAVAGADAERIVGRMDDTVFVGDPDICDIRLLGGFGNQSLEHDFAPVFAHHPGSGAGFKRPDQCRPFFQQKPDVVFLLPR